MEQTILRLCAARLSAWYAEHFRPLPWRTAPTPYAVWVSEIMLQQTRIEAVRPYYARFMRRLPDVASLAAVPEDELLKLWEGLGYYSRARHLRDAAQILCAQYGGELPADYDRLRALPGIGDYTAGAIASIAFGIPVPAVDGNVMRVLSRLTADDTDVLSSGAKAHFAQIAQQMMPEDMPGRFNQALMELGETVCLPNARPLCEQCPLGDFCLASAGDLTEQLPVRSPKKPRRVEERTVAVVLDSARRVLLHKRPATGLLAGLWELPNAPMGQSPLPPELTTVCRPTADTLPDGKHLFTHIEWRMHGIRLDAPDISLPDGYVWATEAGLREQYALPSAFRTYATLLPAMMRE